ncbi:MAG: hypothetical protein ACRD0P_10825, partial [Stackebrandtia sp.]
LSIEDATADNVLVETWKADDDDNFITVNTTIVDVAERKVAWTSEAFTPHFLGDGMAFGVARKGKAKGRAVAHRLKDGDKQWTADAELGDSAPEGNLDDGTLLTVPGGNAVVDSRTGETRTRLTSDVFGCVAIQGNQAACNSDEESGSFPIVIDLDAGDSAVAECRDMEGYTVDTIHNGVVAASDSYADEPTPIVIDSGCEVLSTELPGPILAMTGDQVLMNLADDLEEELAIYELSR